MAALRTNNSYLQALYRRKKPQLGHGRALGAVKHSLLIAMYHMLSTGELYHPPIVHPDAERKQKERTINRLVGQLEKLGHSVTLNTAMPQPAVAP